MALEALLKPSVVEVGKIKIGCLGEERTAKNGNKYRVPMKLDHFRLTTLNRDNTEQLIADDELMASLKENCDTHDGKLRRLPILLMSNTLDEIMSARYVAYAGKQTAAKSDGLVVTEYMDKPGGAWLKEPRTTAHVPEVVAFWKMKLATTLNVMVASHSSRWGGVYRFRTTSKITADQLYGSLLRVQQLTGGILKGVPLWMVVRPMQVAPEGKPTTVYVVHIELAGSDLRAIREAAVDQMRYELANVKEVKALQGQMKQLLAHTDDLDDDELSDHVPDGEFTTAGELVTASGEVIRTELTPEQVAEAKRLADDKKAFAPVLTAKGWVWADVIEWINADFEQQFTADTKFAELPPNMRIAVSEHLLQQPNS